MGDHSFISDGSRRDFLKKLVKMAYAAPVVVSVTMLDTKLDVATARAQATNCPACPTCPPTEPQD